MHAPDGVCVEFFASRARVFSALIYAAIAAAVSSATDSETCVSALHQRQLPHLRVHSGQVDVVCARALISVVGVVRTDRQY